MAVEIRYKTMALALAAMLAGSCSFVVSAQDRDSTAISEEKNWASDTTLSIDEVMVVATRTSQEVVPVQMLSGEKLRSLGTHSIADAIRYFSGVQIKDFGGIGGLKSINVRSLGSQHVGVFYDGVELGNAQNGIVDLGRFSLDNMSRSHSTTARKAPPSSPPRTTPPPTRSTSGPRSPVSPTASATTGTSGSRAARS